jgi:hypothetical protein
MKERRKQDRLNPKKFWNVYDRQTKQQIGKLVNLSSEGAMFITPRPAKASTTYQCRVELPLELLGQPEIIFDAECRWCRKNVKADQWESGYKLNVAGKHAKSISYLVLTLKLGYWGDENIADATTREMESRRRQIRYELEEMLPVYELQSYRQIGYLADLSIQGARLITKKRIKKDALNHCRVALSRSIPQQEYLVFDSMCMWCRRSSDGVQYESGHRIVNISEKDSAVLLNLLIHHAEAQLTTKRIQVVK